MKNSQSNILVSLIITNHNYKTFLPRCINSVIHQTISNKEYEIIVVDDASKDGSRDIIKQFEGFKNFFYIFNKKNIGVSASANKAIKKARGKYFVRLDADDYVSNEFLKIMTLYMESNNDLFGLACDYYLVQKNNKLRIMSCEDSPISCGILYDRIKFLQHGGYNSKFKHREEEELRIRLKDKYKLNYLKIPLYRYRMHTENKTNSKDYFNKFRNKINYLDLRKNKNNKFKNKNTVALLKNVVAIIPARGNSKRLKDKNIYPVWGKPMIYWTIEAAKKSKLINSIYVSSESDKIINIAKKYKIKTIKRPKNLSQSNVYKIEALKHAVNEIVKKDKKNPTLVVSLQANSPEIVYQDIDKAINQLVKYNLNEVDSVDKYLNQNGAIRVVRLKSLFQESLSTHFGVIKTNINDIHTKQDLFKLKLKKNVL
jgi:glycosyltransferase involved in cell wall biosynthesis